MIFGILKVFLLIIVILFAFIMGWAFASLYIRKVINKILKEDLPNMEDDEFYSLIDGIEWFAKKIENKF